MKNKIVLATLVACLIPISSSAGISKVNQKKIDTIKLMYSQSKSAQISDDSNEGLFAETLLNVYGSKGLKRALRKQKKYSDFSENPSCTEILPSLYYNGIPRDDIKSQKISSYKIRKNGRVRVTIRKRTMNGEKLKYVTDFSLSCPSSGQCKITDMYPDGDMSLIKMINQSCNANTI